MFGIYGIYVFVFLLEAFVAFGVWLDGVLFLMFSSGKLSTALNLMNFCSEHKAQKMNTSRGGSIGTHNNQT